jgi:hypothetical protein
MSFKLLQFSPEASTRVRMRSVPEHWTTDYEYSRGAHALPTWADVDQDSVWDEEKRRLNWGAISGLALSLAIGCSFWIGLGLLVARALR